MKQCKVFGIQNRIWWTLAWCTAVFVNCTRDGPDPNEGEGVGGHLQQVSPALQRGAGGSRG